MIDIKRLNRPTRRTATLLAAILSQRGVIALGVAAFISLVSAAGCEGPTGPSLAEVEAKKHAAEAEKQAAEAEHRANDERRLREQEAERRSKSDEAAQHYSTMAFVAGLIVALVAGLIIGTSLGLKTPRE
jgi:hypothetical protein